VTGVPAYVLRYWESEFKLLRPRKNSAGQRLYRRPDVDLVLRIKSLLYEERLTLEGARKRLLAESRGRHRQLDLGLRDAKHQAVLRRVRERLEAVRKLLNPGTGHA
jgi:DNA-binding transcriptional MerR regulator